MPTPSEVLSWNVDGLATVGDAATKIADAILKASDTLYTAIHDGLDWKGAAATAAETKAENERTQMRAIVTAYDDLGTATKGAFSEMEHPLAEIKTILRTYVVPPVAISDDWTVTGVEDWDSEAGLELERLSGLLTTLLAADAKWGQQIADAVGEVQRMAPAAVLATTTTEIQKIKAQDPNAVADAIATSPASFWAPDIPTTTANVIIGSMTDVTRDKLDGAARAGNDGVLKWVQNWGERTHNTSRIGPVKITSGLSRMGIIGNAIGTVPAIADDIDGGMSRSEAIVSESVGTGVGMAAGALSGAYAGAAIGSVFPGAGTAVGFVVGAGVGAVFSHFTSKGIQRLWD
ncbi:hypothetical protein [Nocardia sp. NPDC050406]|uniref:hypothetical protein n=1 Tax=Nocardia sp. NPDC050406 TaxID=3364318 RepID=UPI0037ACC4EB